ncbi:P-loop containing nucleoside triphosphate hydrolase protein [Hysterangium stoloniferum]|nr:P-loop containing nucleoside triphosphate hydrolase protein [Hysterangium stoloniferum]
METSIPQNLLHGPSNLPLRTFSRERAGDAVKFLCDTRPPHIGIAIKQSNAGKVCAIALATCTPGHADQVVVISVGSGSRSTLPSSEKRFRDLLNGESGTILAGFDMPQTLLFTFRDLGLNVAGVDLVSSFPKDEKTPAGLVKKAFQQLKSRGPLNLMRTNGNPESDFNGVGLRAWVVAQRHEKGIINTIRVRTVTLQRKERICLAEMLLQFDRFERIKPTVAEGEITDSNEDRNVDSMSTAQTVIITNSKGSKFGGKVTRAEGKTASITVGEKRPIGGIEKIKVIGKEAPTNAENARNNFVLDVLTGESHLSSTPFIRILWFDAIPAPSTPRTDIPSGKLNESQHKVLCAMTGDAQLVTVHGPPGTGKTRVIAAAAQVWLSDSVPVWIVAQSNVAVKNIAEKLVKEGVEFKLIVSKEFYFEWHEHIYEKIEANIIGSDKLQRMDKDQLDKIFGSCKVVLATLGMLSNPTVSRGVINHIPVERLVIDEASQINHIFDKFKKTLIKSFCSFNVVAPFGIDDIPSLKSIFDIPHICRKTYFLNTQYRMPVPLGNFISEHVYKNELRSKNDTESTSCLAFVEAGGTEQKSGRSWVNMREVQAIVHLVQNYYKKEEFCVITPYDAQRAAIAKALKNARLPEMVFNVDSFQGNLEISIDAI